MEACVVCGQKEELTEDRYCEDCETAFMEGVEQDRQVDLARERKYEN